MRITKQSSGGRGEWELAEDAPNGIRPADLLERSMHLRFGPYTIDTGIRLEHDESQGKWRLRLIAEGTRYTHVGYQVAYALLMPEPIREEAKLLPGLPVLQARRYLISNVYLGQVEYSGDDAFEADVRWVEYENQSYKGQQLPVADRILAIEAIWRGRRTLPTEIAGLVEQHEAAVRAGTPIPAQMRTVISRLQRELATFSDDLEVEFAEPTDPVPALAEVLGHVLKIPEVSPEEVDPEQFEVRTREIVKWQQWARRRGAASVAFKKKVREAYNSRCVMCGSYFPPTAINRNPGVDAAHILPWSRVDLDNVLNGVALCKLHHWAFDEHLLAIRYENGQYRVEIPERAVEALTNSGFSLDVLRAVEGPIPTERLPLSPQHRPRPELLKRWDEMHS